MKMKTLELFLTEIFGEKFGMIQTAGVSALSLVFVVRTEQTLVYSVCIKKAVLA